MRGARTRIPRRPLTAEEARTFEGGKRLSGYQRVMLLLALRAEREPRFQSCECEPYQDVYTFGRWKAQGMSVQKGEKGMKHSCFIRTDGETVECDEDDAQTVAERKAGKLRPWVTYLFCRCQVAPQKLSKRQQRELRKAELKTRLAELQAALKASREARVQRPPWAVGWTDETLIRLAEQEGCNPYQPDWWAGIDRVAVAEYKSRQLPSRRREAEQEAARIRQELEALERRERRRERVA